VALTTHNPNISVSGDAGQILVIEGMKKDEARVVVRGSIDNGKVIAQVTSIMEGSERAFEIHAEKYGYQLSRSDSA